MGKTAEQVVQGISLAGKTAIVTGANSGIGAETARVLALAGAHVVMGCRTVATGEAAAKDFEGSFEVKALDLADLASVRHFAEEFLASKRALNLLVNNAGVMATPRGKTKQGSEMQVGTNHVGHFLLTKLLLPALEAGAPSRIVNVSSALHKRGKGDRLLETLAKDPSYEKRSYAPFDAYGDSKLANVLFTKELAKKLPPGVEAFSLHPGVIATNLTRSMGALGSVYKAVGGLFMKSIPQGAATTVYAAVSPDLKGKSGAYLSDVHVAKASAAGNDAELAKKLWDVSERLTAI